MKHSRVIKIAQRKKNRKFSMTFKPVVVEINRHESFFRGLETMHPSNESKKVVKGWNIILEGGDCTGKSTIYPLLAEKLEILVGHRAEKPSNFYTANIEMFTQLNSMNIQNNKHCLYERSFISELIYGIRFRKYTHEQEMVFFEALKYIPENTIIFILTAQQEELIKRYQKRGDSFVKATEILSIDAEYMQLAQAMVPKTKAKVVIIDTTGSIESVVEAIASVFKVMIK